MNKSILLGIWRFLVRIPRSIWQREVNQNEKQNRSRTDFMGEDHHKVRDFVVLELPRRGRPIRPEEISNELNLSPAKTQQILDELERGMTFLFRNAEGEVAWAYPVTVELTPHRLQFNSGERVYAA